jgi:archaellum component FlaF (FlaF/FlaG flagellin family)
MSFVHYLIESIGDGYIEVSIDENEILINGKIVDACNVLDKNYIYVLNVLYNGDVIEGRSRSKVLLPEHPHTNRKLKKQNKPGVQRRCH